MLWRPSYFTLQKDFDYRKYMEQRSHFEVIEKAVYNSSSEIVGSISQFSADAREHYLGVSRKLAESNEISATIRDKVDLISEATQRTNSILEWGFSRTLTSLDNIGSSLSALVQIAKTPDQTWAYEQYEIAVDAVRKGMFSDAVYYMEAAVNGNEHRTGYRLEYRFYFLLGTIFLGDSENFDPNFVDLPRAQDEFLKSSRYARTDFPFEAARSLAAAAWAAYCSGDPNTAKQHLEAALKLSDSCSEAHFNLGRILLLEGSPVDKQEDTATRLLEMLRERSSEKFQFSSEKVERHFLRAFELNAHFAFIVSQDERLDDHRGEVDACLEEFRRNIETSNSSFIQKARSLYVEAKGNSVSGVLDAAIKELDKDATSAKNANVAVGLSLRDKYKDGDGVIYNGILSYINEQKRLITPLDQSIDRKNVEISEIYKREVLPKFGWIVFIGSGLGCVVFSALLLQYLFIDNSPFVIVKERPEAFFAVISWILFPVYSLIFYSKTHSRSQAMVDANVRLKQLSSEASERKSNVSRAERLVKRESQQPRKASQ